MATEEIELNFRLDGDGRTALPEGEHKGLVRAKALHYETQTVRTSFTLSSDNSDDGLSTSNEELMDELLMDCEIADSGLMPRTFWIPSNGTPRFGLEQMALDVFEHHVQRLSDSSANTNTTLVFDPETSGAEWWVQLRPSPEKAGRYSMLVHNQKDDHGEGSEKDLSKSGISFHWDKDEDLRILCGGNTYLHAHISTVTYLTDLGAPTLAVNCRVHPFTGEWMVPSARDESEKDKKSEAKDELEAFVCWPLAGKHLSFDGRFLHAAPSDLMEEGAFERQCKFTPSDDKVENRKLQRRHRRVTFLVNVWINYRPFNVDRFPDSMVDKMSGHDKKQLARVSFPDNEHNQQTIPSKVADVISGVDSSVGDAVSSQSMESFIWPMGGCDSGETIKMKLPLDTIREEAKVGGNVRLRYIKSPGGIGDGGVVLAKADEEEVAQSQPKRPKTQGSLTLDQGIDTSL